MGFLVELYIHRKVLLTKSPTKFESSTHFSYNYLEFLHQILWLQRFMSYP